MTSEDSRGRLLAGVWGRRQEIGDAVLDRVHAIGPSRSADPEYREGLRQATEAAIDCTIQALEGRSDPDASAPGPLLSQARLAARRRVPLEVILRRYLAGNAVLGDFVLEEAERLTVSAGVLRLVLHSQAMTTDQVVAIIGTTYLEEAASIRRHSSDERRAELAGRLLDGDLIDPAPLDYGFDRWHLAFVLTGHQKVDDIDTVAADLDARRLVVPVEDEVWVWLGTRDRAEPRRIEEAAAGLPADIRIGIGEPAAGLSGWRLTHHQAKAALVVGSLRSGKLARYSDIALTASMLGDELLLASLRSLYLLPLSAERDGGRTSKATLRAYFLAERNVSSAAAALRVNRQTVVNRLRAIEKKIGRSLNDCAAELEATLEGERLGVLAAGQSASGPNDESTLPASRQIV